MLHLRHGSASLSERSAAPEDPYAPTPEFIADRKDMVRLWLRGAGFDPLADARYALG
jgi:hypothetical protein